LDVDKRIVLKWTLKKDSLCKWKMDLELYTLFTYRIYQETSGICMHINASYTGQSYSETVNGLPINYANLFSGAKEYTWGFSKILKTA
jgi:hypothetical protein